MALCQEFRNKLDVVFDARFLETGKDNDKHYKN